MVVYGVGVSYNAKESVMAEQMNKQETPQFSGGELLREARAAFIKGADWMRMQLDDRRNVPMGIVEKARDEYPIKVIKPNIIKTADRDLWVKASFTGDQALAYNHPTNHTLQTIIVEPVLNRAFLAAAAQALATPWIETSE